jgi:hypothetical protein
VPELSEVLAAHNGPGYVVAPAGFGKTHLIAAAVAQSAGRQLVLTHTYAGVNALRRKMRDLRVPQSAFHIDTIASWALRLSLSYSSTSNWTVERPADNLEWTRLYEACATLLEQAFVRRIIQCSYTGLYVDEYQDCSISQHGIVLALARLLPCRVLGDPLQAIFDFEGQHPVAWERDVAGNFQLMGALNTPHRWNRAGAPEIGLWLRTVRERLENAAPLDLSNGLPRDVRFRTAGADGDLFREQGNACRYFECDRQHTVIAVHGGRQEYKAKCHALARNLSGRFSSIEEIEGKVLFRLVAKLDRARTNANRLKHVIGFAEKCMTAVNENLPAGTARCEHVEIRANTKNPQLAKWANAYLAEPGSANMSGFLTVLQNIDGVETVRVDLYNRMIGILRKHVLHPECTLAEAAESYHSEFRHRGRPVGRRKLIGTTLLVKGLEFDHAIVLDASSLSRKELYVALTRGSRSLTVISPTAVLNPAP